jgi:Fe-S cluster assembly protein SufD
MKRQALAPAYAAAEANKYTSFRDLKDLAAAAHELEVEGVTALSLSQALERDSSRLEAVLGRLATGPWADASLSASYSLHVLEVGAGEQPAVVRVKAKGSGVSHVRFVVLPQIGVQRDVQIMFTDDGTPGHHLNAVFEVDVAMGAALRLQVFQDHGDQGWLTATWAAKVARDARFDAVWVDQGAALSRHDIQVALNEPGAQTHLSGLMVPRSGQHHDHHVHVCHGAQSTTSRQLFKGLVGAGARSVFSGCVEVLEGAESCCADQLSRGLLLGHGAEFDARPQLLISVDAVEASHGTSCGAMDEEALFFLRSRGLDAEAAKHLLAEAFAGEVLEQLGDEGLVQRGLDTVRGCLAMRPS